jgi:hypothetical protein
MEYVLRSGGTKRAMLRLERPLVALSLIVASVALVEPGWAKPNANTAIVHVELESEAEADDAMVLVNGKEIGPVPLSLTLQPGRYLIEVAKPGRQTWRRWLDVKAGEQQALSAELPPVGGGQPKPAATGSVLVACDVLDAEVLVDGKRVGTVPVLVESLTPGKHSVSVRSGARQREAQVEVQAGQTTKLSLSLAPPKRSKDGPTPPQPTPADLSETSQKPTAAPAKSVENDAEGETTVDQPPEELPLGEAGALEVSTDPAGAEVFVDGVSRGVSPVTIDQLEPGSHYVEARSIGTLPMQKIVNVAPGSVERVALRLQAEPSARKGELVVRTAKPGARVFVNGKELGTTPMRQALLIGPHVVTVRREGSQEHMTTVEVRADRATTLDLTLEPSEEPASAEAENATSPQVESSDKVMSPASEWRSRPTDIGLMGTYSAQLVQPSYVMADFSTGFPYLAQVRVTTGIADYGQFGIDGGVDLRTYGAMTELGLRGRLRLLADGPWSIAGSLALGGGGGPKGRSTFFVEAGGIASLLLMNRVNLSLRGAINVYTDRHCPATAAENELGVCSQPPSGMSTDQIRDRFGGVRFIVGAVAEVPINRWLNLFAALDMAPFQGNRKAFSDNYAQIMPESDPGLYGCVGMTIKR